MSRRLWLLAALALSAGCSKAPEFKVYSDPGGDYSMEIPKDWRQEGQSDLRRKPAAANFFIGKEVANDNGAVLGAVLSMAKFYRLRGDYPGKDQNYEKFGKEVLAPSDQLFASSGSFSLSGLPARTYRKDFVYDNPGTPFDRKVGPYSMRLEDVVVQTPQAYYVLEYRATKDLFDKHYFAFEKAKATLRIKPSAG